MKTKEKKYENILDPEKSGKEVHKALMSPIRTLARILRKKLKGAYGHFNTQGWIRLEETDHHHFIDDFPGYCRIDSINGPRFISVSINFSWWRNNKQSSLEIDLNDFEKNTRHWVVVEALDDSEFINGIKDWLKNKKEMSELPWEKWKP